MQLPVDKRPICFRLSSEIYHAVFEAVGAASMAWNPRPSSEVFHSEEASKIAIDLCFKIANEIEREKSMVWGRTPIRPTMDELACRETVPELWTDKRSPKEGFVCHDYYRIYEREFTKWRDHPIRILEIGINVGASIKVWLDYFTQAKVYGVDIEEFHSKVGELDPARFTFVRGDQSDPEFWQAFIHTHGTRWDIIIDDGCHFSGPIIESYRALWQFVAPGGYYVIEDLSEVRNPASHTPNYPNQIEFVQNLVAGLNVKPNDVDEIMCSYELCVLRKKQ